VRPEGDVDFAPSESDVRVVALFFGDSTDFIHERKGVLEIWERELARDVVLVDDAPVGQLMAEVVKLLAFEGGHAATAGDASLTS